MASFDCDTTQEPQPASSSTDNDSADTKVPKSFISLCDELAIDSFTYRQLQETAKQYGIPCNLKKHLLADIIKARLKGRTDYVKNKISEVRYRRMKARQMSRDRKTSDDHDFNALKAFIKSGRTDQLLKREPTSMPEEARTSTQTKRPQLQTESAHHLMLKRMVKKCAARNVTITQTQSHTRIQMRPSLLDNCVQQFMNHGRPVSTNHKVPLPRLTMAPNSVNPPYLAGPMQPPPYAPNMIQAGCSPNLFANSSDYLPKPIMPPSFNVQQPPQMNFPQRSLQMAETSVCMNGKLMHFYNAKTSDYPRAEEKNKMVCNPQCQAEILGLPYTTNQRQPPPYMQSQWNMNNYQHGYPTPVQDFGGLDNRFGLRHALPFTETMTDHNFAEQTQQGVPLDSSYHEQPEAQVLPQLNSVLPRRISFNPQHAPSSTVLCDLACLADTASSREANNADRLLVEATPEQSQLFLQTETITGNMMEIPTWTKFLEQNPVLSTPPKFLCRYGCSAYLRSELEMQNHEDQCLHQLVSCPRPGCTWRNQIGSLGTHVYNNHYLEIAEGNTAHHQFNLNEVDHDLDGPIRLCVFQHAGRRLFIISAIVNFPTKEIFVYIQCVNDGSNSVSTAVLEVVKRDGTPAQWVERVGIYNGSTTYYNHPPPPWDGRIAPISTSVMQLTTRRHCLVMSTDELVSPHELKLFVIIRPHQQTPQ